MNDNLKPSKRDYVVSVANGIVGACPFAGAFFVEIIQNVIPNQRIDRIVRFLQILDEKVKQIELKNLGEQFKDEKFVDLLEDGFFAAARALSEERRQYLASLVANSLSNKDLEYSQGKILIQLLNELSDPEVIILQYYGKDLSDDRDEYYGTHSHVLEGPAIHMQSSTDEIDKEALHATYKAHLEKLQLVKPHFKTAGSGKTPEFDDKTGMMKVSYHEITWLGRLLLRLIGLDAGPL